MEALAVENFTNILLNRMIYSENGTIALYDFYIFLRDKKFHVFSNETELNVD